MTSSKKRAIITSSSSSSSSSSSDDQQQSPPPENQASLIDQYAPSAIPIGFRFQADIPDLIGPANYMESDTSKWLGTKTWPLNNTLQTTTDNAITIGGGRPNSCTCRVPGMPKCIKTHVGEEMTKLRTELGPAFDNWSLDQMGEGAASNWGGDERTKFESIVNKCKGKEFLALALERLPNKSREAILRYYYSIIVARKIGMQSRCGKSATKILTDDSSDDDVAASGSSSRRRAKKKSKVVPEAKKKFLKAVSR